jgi:ubiquinone/menaquinone biosynthesis C-methylase UbiE
MKKKILELGCGGRKRIPESIGIDILDLPGVDLVGDAIDVLRTFESQSVDEVHSHHFLTHLEDLSEIFRAIDRVLISGGTLHTTVPHFSNPYYYSDYTHKTHFGLYTFNYFFKSDYFTRQVPQYGNQYSYHILDVRLNFKSPRPFYFRWLVKKSLTFWVNMNHWTKELYEENLCYLIPCYEIHIKLQKK